MFSGVRAPRDVVSELAFGPNVQRSYLSRTKYHYMLQEEKPFSLKLIYKAEITQIPQSVVSAGPSGFSAIMIQH